MDLCHPYRPLLADIIQTGDVKELCKLLVTVSGEATKAYTGIALGIMLISPFSCSVSFQKIFLVILHCA
jgi:hypothetical protein